jgi:hypothetical protein
MSLYWLCYRHNNHVCVVIEPAPSLMRAALAGLDEGHVIRGKAITEARWPYSFSSAVNLNPKRARPPATIRAAQLNHLGADQSPMMTGQSSKIRTRWNSATKVKIIPATQRYVFRSMSD